MRLLWVLEVGQFGLFASCEIHEEINPLRVLSQTVGVVGVAGDVWGGLRGRLLSLTQGLTYARPGSTKHSQNRPHLT